MSEKIAIVAGWLCFVLVCVFYGADINLIVFLGAILALLVGLSLVTAPLATELLKTPQPFVVAGLGLAGLLISYQFSLSKDSSFVATWVLALTPLTFLLARGVGTNVGRLHQAIGMSVLVFAALSCWQFLFSGIRASLPLADPNNYGALLYLILLPWMHGHFVRCSQSGGPTLAVHIGVQAAFFVMFMALMATQSRVSLVIIAVALGLWGGLGIARRLDWRPVAVSAALALGAYVIIGSMSGVPGEFGRSFDLNTGLEARLALLRSAFDMYDDHPLTGIGLFVFPLMYRHLRETVDQGTAGLFVHNDYVQLLVEGGPLLLLAIMAFTIGVLVRFARGVRASPDSPAFSSLGWVIALGAALAHAAVNFTLFSPVLGIVLGITAARVFCSERSDIVDTPCRTNPQLKASRTLLVVGLVVGWVAWLYLALDTAIAGVLQNQPRVPFAAGVREDPDRMLRFARIAQTLNGNRGVPVLAEAALLDQRLRQNPDSEYLRERTLASYRRAGEVDPWNPLTHLLMVNFITAQPEVVPLLREDETPELLLLRTISIDPLYVPGINALMDKLTGEGRQAEAYHLLRQRVYPWLVLLARQDTAAAENYRQYLQRVAEAQGDGDFAAELAALGPTIAGVGEIVKDRWFF